MAAGRLLWSSLSGMEITLFVLLSILIISSHLKEISTGKVSLLTGVLLGVAANTRPETYLLAGLYYLTTLYLLRGKLKGNFPKLVLSGVIFVLLLLPYPLFSYMHTGGFLPNTYEGQVGAAKYIPSIKFLKESAKIFIKDNFVIFVLWGISAVYFIYAVFRKKVDKNFLLLNLWIFLLPLVSSFIAPNWRHHGRYLIPLIPFINISAIYILRKLHAYYEAKGYKRFTLFRKATIAIILVVSINSGVLFAAVLGWNVENINNQQGKIAEWLNENLPGETAFGMNDIGIITLKTKKYVVDMAGLVTPEVFSFQKMSYEDGTKALFKFLKAKDVNYIIIYPDWFEYIMANYSGAFTRVHSEKLEKNTICGGIEMMVYKINWDKIDLNKKIPGQNTN